MEVGNIKKKFCSNKCRVYFNRHFADDDGGYIYCLKNPLEDNKVFYIGKTIGSLSKRLSNHICGKNKNTEKDKIINSILDAGVDIIIEEIEFVENISILNKRERFWIQEFSRIGLSNKMFNAKKGKSEPIGVRFDLDKLNMIQKEQNLTSAQGVLNYLMDNYVSKNCHTTFG
jgi:Zn-finger protein